MSSSRRTFVKAAASVAVTAHRMVSAQDRIPSRAVPFTGPPVGSPVLKSVRTPVLEIGYEETWGGRSSGDPATPPAILLHGFPDDVRAWDGVVPALAAGGVRRVLVPYLRGFGPTRFLDSATPRRAEQAAIGQDLIDFADALNIKTFDVIGYDWGGRAACVAAALHPERVTGAVLIGGYTIQNVFSPPVPEAPETEHAYWYQWYFNTERGRAGLTANRRALCKLLWKLWSPHMQFTDEQFERTAKSFDNPDFVDCVIHSYRHRHGNAPGEPRFEADERKLAQFPRINAPTVLVHGADDGIRKPPAESAEQPHFPHLVFRRVVAGAGHFVPRERPDAVVAALRDIGQDRL
jgi:pimeloyl-ACP methyl ester carboxylesterase